MYVHPAPEQNSDAPLLPRPSRDTLPAVDFTRDRQHFTITLATRFERKFSPAPPLGIAAVSGPACQHDSARSAGVPATRRCVLHNCRRHHDPSSARCTSLRGHRHGRHARTLASYAIDCLSTAPTRAYAELLQEKPEETARRQMVTVLVPGQHLVRAELQSS